MSVARIYQTTKSSTQSGKARSGIWVLQHEPAERQRHDPLTGWIGSGDTDMQVRLTFPTEAAAVEYAERNGIAYEIARDTARELRIQAYADNFR